MNKKTNRKLNVIVSRRSGFCFGVKRAVSLTDNRIRSSKKTYSLGPLIHNKWVVNEFLRKGLNVITKVSEAKKGSYVILPSHGVDPGRILEKGYKFVDTTCPFVFKTQAIVKKLIEDRYRVLILGDKNHPEVKSLVGISCSKALVIGSVKDKIPTLPPTSKVALVSQTTQSLSDFVRLSMRLLAENFEEFRIFNTICMDARDRQEEAKRIARVVDLLIVIGGKHSANTKRLVKVCRGMAQIRHIETENEIMKEWIKNKKTIGIVTGASTPGAFVEKVKVKIKCITKNNRKCEQD